MFLGKKRYAALLVLSAVLLLSACGSKESNGEKVPKQDGAPPKETLLFSKAIEENSLWIETSATPERNSSVRGVLVFDNGEVTSYGNISDENKLTLEEVNNLSDDEIIQNLEKNSQSINKGKYSFDITLDELGQNTKELSIILDGGYTNIWTFDVESLYAESGLSSKDEYLASLKKDGENFEVNCEYITFTKKVEEPSTTLKVIGNMVSQKIFDTNYVGLRTDEDKAILTRVDDDASSVTFEIDSPNNKGENVTIEGK